MIKNKIILILLLFFIFGCEKQPQFHERPYPFIELKDVADIDGGGATLKAELFCKGNSEIMEYGFIIGLQITPTIEDRKISFKGDINNYIFEKRIENDLLAEHHYYVRAFVKSKEYLVYSNEKEFISKGCKKPEIFEINPNSGTPGKIITISGNYFSEYSINNIVKFGNVDASVIYASIDTLIIRCPDMNASQINISVNVAGQEVLSSYSFDVISPWNKLVNFPGGNRFYGAYFTIGDKGYTTLGIYANNILDRAPADLWEYDLNEKLWNRRQSFPGELRSNTINFSVEGKGYIGLGMNSSYQSLYDLWEYDPTTDNWKEMLEFPRKIDIPFFQAHFVVNNRLFLIPTLFTDLEVWVFDPLENNWTDVYSEEFEKYKIFQEGFSLNNTGYFIETLYSEISNKEGIVLWRYDDLINEMSAEDTILTSRRIEPCSFNIENKLYLSIPDGKLIEYDLNNKLTYVYKHSSDNSMYNFKFIFGDKAILNNSESNEVYEFYLQ